MSREQTIKQMAFIQGQIDKLPSAPTCDELLGREFDPVRWIVRDLIPTGVTILAGAPKIGKSWIVLGMAWAVSVGGCVLGSIHVEQNTVLYLALEDNERRLKDRLKKVADHGSGRLYLPTTWKRGREGINHLEAWMLKHPETRAIFVDTLQRLMGVEDFNSYRETYDAIVNVKEVADRYKIGIVLVHHTKKAPVQERTHDWINDVAGSIGSVGGADTIITMRRPRGQNDGVLNVTGRDVAEREVPIRFDPSVGTWTIITEEEEKTIDGKMKAAGE